jgi:hypothetical protein
MRFSFVVWLTGLLCTCALAQDSPKAEVFGRYSYASADFTGSGRENLNGWDGSLTGNFNHWMGVTADIRGLIWLAERDQPAGGAMPAVLLALSLEHARVNVSGWSAYCTARRTPHTFRARAVRRGAHVGER